MPGYIQPLLKKVLLWTLGIITGGVAGGQSWIRINQLGYTEQDVKVAVLVSKAAIRCSSFSLVDAATGAVVFTGNKVRSFPAYAAFKTGFRLDFSAFRKPGRYYIKAGDVVSPAFPVSNRVYDGTADFILNYMRQQRSRYNPFLDDSCHTADGFIVYHNDKSKDSTRIDVAGGWHDASDYLQYLPTSANATFQLLFAYMKNPGSFGDHYDAAGRKGSNGIPDILDEARWGLEWMVKMNPGKEEYYNQIADDRDHRGMRLPTKDTVKYATNMGLSRPVYFISGKPQGPKYQNRTTGVASSAGKFASAFALGAQLLEARDPAFAKELAAKAKEAYAFGKKYPGNNQTIPFGAPYFYEEDNYVDDMELAALALYGIDKKQDYLQEAIGFARKEPVTPWMGADTARHYQWYPFVNLGHYFGTKQAVHSKEYLAFMKDGIERVKKRGAGNPFLMGVPFIWCSNNLTVAILTQISLYKEASGDHQYDELEAALRDWLLGCNPWGTSMICDLPEQGVAPKDPHSAFTHLYGYKISGGLVDGPIYGSIWNKLIGIKLYRPDTFAAFQSPLVIYHDDYGDYSSNEPTMDGTASLSYYLSRQQASAHQEEQFVTDKEGAVVGIPGKKVYLIFSAHDNGEGGPYINAVLKKNRVKASFFFTGDFLRDPAFRPLVLQLKKDGHYIASHSDKHLLYNDWKQRDSLLVTHEAFSADLKNAYNELHALGIEKGKWFLPPYEWYNKKITEWAAGEGLTVINFTPGTGTNADYTWPEQPNYKSSGQLLDRLKQREAEKGLSGNFILIHYGTDDRRTDKFYKHLDAILSFLRSKGYQPDRLP
ncbi:glycoside hydrolase family 9 protein [Niabella beijingensis]|uniref:glycoside hydrolase family 9 protein n=1 Tax=Niabella beijingensis TaxID=2872700 RepID=UPI001CBCA6D2|nr:glycoside hydrolase family 9 protein [Niabella beijingensis]MBZ4192082.1 glycoside hydrolase family 9 protein [Niabella beijingensis]